MAIKKIELIRKHLESGKTLTPLEALGVYGMYRLAACVHTLKHRDGLNIVADVKTDPRGTQYAEYRLASKVPPCVGYVLAA
jgi:hypothetical protein